MDHGIGQDTAAVTEWLNRQEEEPPKRKSRNRRLWIAVMALSGIAFTVWMNRGPADPDAIAIEPPIIAPGIPSDSDSNEPNPIADLTNLRKLSGSNSDRTISDALDEFVSGEPGLARTQKAGPILIPTRDLDGTSVRQANFAPMRTAPRIGSGAQSQAAWLTGTIEPVNDSVADNSPNTIQIR